MRTRAYTCSCAVFLHAHRPTSPQQGISGPRPPGGQAPPAAHLPAGPSFPLCPTPCAPPTAHPRAVPFLHMPATLTPAHAFPRPPKDPNRSPRTTRTARGPPQPCPAHTCPAPRVSHVSLPGAGVSAALGAVGLLGGDWVPSPVPAVTLSSTSKLGGMTARSHALQAHPCPPPSRRRKPTGLPSPGAQPSSWKRGRNFL